MIVLKWNQARSKIVSRMSALDQSIAKQVDVLETAWEKQRDGAYVESDAALATRHTPGSDPAATHEERDRGEMPPAPESVPEYLR